MKIHPSSFNIYLVGVLTLLAVGCRTPEERKHDKEASTLALFLEAAHGDSFGNGVAVYRETPVHFNFGREPFLTEADLQEASVVDLPGGYGIRAQFNGHGAMVLEGVTVGHRGAHIGILSHFPETRWLAAPVIKHRITNGELIFTPDATRDEADRIVRGLNNVVHEIHKRSFID